MRPEIRTLAAVLVALALAASAGEERPCGTERWGAKTDTDGAQLAEASPTEVRTVAQLAALAAPKYREGRPREGEELNVVAVVGYLRAVKLEEDGDLHLLVSDTPDGPTMVMEAPSPDCAAESPRRERMGRARAAVAAMLGAVFGRNFRWLSSPKKARFTGAIFFDKLHGQTGMLANGAELHPLLGVDPL